MEASAGFGASGAAVTLCLCIQADGCPTICRQCWAQDVGYDAIPAGDIAWVLDGGRLPGSRPASGRLAEDVEGGAVAKGATLSGGTRFQ